MLRPLASVLLLETVRAARRLWKSPRFVSAALLTVAAATAPSLLFDRVGRAVLPPLPFERSEDLVFVWQSGAGVRVGTAYPKLGYLREHSRTIDVAAGTGGTFFMERGSQSVRLQTYAVTPNFFDVLRAKPQLGRLFGEDENQHPFAHPVIVLGDAFWRKQFDGRVDVVGQKISLNGTPFTILGVMPKEFRNAWSDRRGIVFDAWIPAMMAPLGEGSKRWRETALALESPNTIIWAGIGRIRDGHTLGEAQAEALVLGQHVNVTWPNPDPDDAPVVPFDVIRLSEEAVNPKILRAVSLLKVAGVLIVVLGGLNLGALFVTRGLERARALSVQAFLGAPRLALVWGPLCDGLFVGVAGGAVAILLARGSLKLLGTVEPSILTSPFGFSFDPAGWRMDAGAVALGFALSTAAALVAGVAPALRGTRRRESEMWRSGTGVLGGLRRLRFTRPGGLLVTLEIAVAVALTLPALLLARSLGGLVTTDRGFRPDGVITAALSLPIDRYPESAVQGFVQQLTTGLEQSTGIEATSWVSCLPIECGVFNTEVRATGLPAGKFEALVIVVAPGAFRTLGVPLQQGRDFTRDDRPDGPRVAILSEQAVQRLGATALGTRVDAFGASGIEVVGIVGEVPYHDLASAPLPTIYFPLGQRPLTQGSLIVRSEQPPRDVAALVRRAVAAVDPRLERLEVGPLSDRVVRDLARFRGAAWLLGAAAVLALLLAGIGIYGVLSSFVARALPEIGIRMALGADRASIAGLVAKTALRLAFAGFIVGAGLGLWGATHLRGYLFGVQPWDVRTLLLGIVVTGCLALATALRPAHTASRIDPIVVLRCE